MVVTNWLSPRQSLGSLQDHSTRILIAAPIVPDENRRLSFIVRIGKSEPIVY